jgi:putative PIN family toxin of toxin-antitoxin system
MKRRIKVLLDTNTWLSISINYNFSSWIDLSENYGFEFVITSDQIKEIERVFYYKDVKKKLISPDRAITIISEMCVLYDVKQKFNLSPDPDDNFLFDALIQIPANVLVTEEKALWAMNGFRKGKHVYPKSTFITLLKEGFKFW